MIPVTMPIALAAADGLAPELQLNAVMFITAAAVGGAIFGDHASPISDTTLLSATGAGCPCLEHVATQLPYAGFIAVCAGIGYIAGSYWMSLAVALVSSLIVFAAGVIVLPKTAKKL